MGWRPRAGAGVVGRVQRAVARLGAQSAWCSIWPPGGVARVPAPGVTATAAASRVSLSGSDGGSSVLAPPSPAGAARCHVPCELFIADLKIPRTSQPQSKIPTRGGGGAPPGAEGDQSRERAGNIGKDRTSAPPPMWTTEGLWLYRRLGC